MIKLNFPDYEFRIVEKESKFSIFDPVRKKYVALTPEEWVRQHVILYLVLEKQVPMALIGSEVEIRLYNTRKRFDLAVYDRNGQALLVVECKAPSVPINQSVLDQAVRYNLTMKVGYLMLTNGMSHLYCHIDSTTGNIRQIDNLPDFKGLQF